jgi:hypothetical protein
MRDTAWQATSDTRAPSSARALPNRHVYQGLNCVPRLQAVPFASRGYARPPVRVTDDCIVPTSRIPGPQDPLLGLVLGESLERLVQFPIGALDAVCDRDLTRHHCDIVADKDLFDVLEIGR